MELRKAIQYHDPREFVRTLQQIMISDTKRIGFLCGAGTSMATKKGASRDSVVPGVQQMTKMILDSISDGKYKKALEQIERELIKNCQIEYILSSIAQKEQAIGKELLCGLKQAEFKELKTLIEKKIIEIISVHKKRDSFVDQLVHCDFIRWIANADRKYPVEIFTTNYDYLFEIAFEYHNVPYFDGFVGSFEPFFSSHSLEELKSLPDFNKLWKLHGSLGWDYCKKNQKIIRKYQDQSTIIVFPSLLKYDNSKKQPYVSFIDRLGRFIRAEDSVLIICGYSFSDQHINEVVLTALERTRSSHVMGLFYDEMAENSDIVKMAKSQPKLSIFGKRNAVIGGKYGIWKLKTEPNKDDSILIDLYFDEDAAIPIDSALQNYSWTGTGEFKLPDFARFVSFLSSLTYDYISVSERKR